MCYVRFSASSMGAGSLSPIVRECPAPQQKDRTAVGAVIPNFFCSGIVAAGLVPSRNSICTSGCHSYTQRGL